MEVTAPPTPAAAQGPDNWRNRCDWCGWPLDPEEKMCRATDCSMRPRPERSDTALRQECRKAEAKLGEMRAALRAVHDAWNGNATHESACAAIARVREVLQRNGGAHKSVARVASTASPDVRAAVLHERERCAKFIARYPSSKLSMFKNHDDKLNAVTLLAEVADAIRASAEREREE